MGIDASKSAIIAIRFLDDDALMGSNFQVTTWL